MEKDTDRQRDVMMGVLKAVGIIFLIYVGFGFFMALLSAGLYAGISHEWEQREQEKIDGPQ